MHWYTDILKNYVGFSGRATRSEYWWFALINFIITLIIEIIDKVAGIYPLLTAIYSLALLLPSLALSFRRLHDTGRSAGWLFIGLIPIIGWIVLLVFYCLDSQPEANKYGPNPKSTV